MLKNFSLKNYLEPIDLKDIINKSELLNNLNDPTSKSLAYPFTKETLINYLISDEFLLNNNEKNDFLDVEIKKRLENIELKKKSSEINYEKRRRYQIYKSLEYQLSNYTYFDFFSYDAFKIAKHSKILAQLYKVPNVTTELLILPFFDSEFSIIEIFKKFGLNQEFINNFNIYIKERIQKAKKKDNQQSIVTKILNKIKKNYKINFFEKDIFINQKIIYSYQVHKIFEKTAENALKRFKTPIITPEILLITLMEDKTLKINDFLKKKVVNETSWYLLRYKLLKSLYKEEVNIKTQVKKNYHFFAYLLKTQIPHANFEKLIEKNYLEKAVFLFRNVLINDLLKNNLINDFEIETNFSLENNISRFYSI